MKTMKNLAISVLMSIMAAATFTACTKDDAELSVNGQAAIQGGQRTVLVYMAGHNHLSRFASSDLEEMKQGSKLIGDDQTLLVFVRRNQSGEEPWLGRIHNGEVTDKVTVSQMGIDKQVIYASDPEDAFYSDFQMTDDSYHGVSLFVPQDASAPYAEFYSLFNEDIKCQQWHQRVNF